MDRGKRTRTLDGGMKKNRTVSRGRGCEKEVGEMKKGDSSVVRLTVK